jgi:hypothetical protein
MRLVIRRVAFICVVLAATFFIGMVVSPFPTFRALAGDTIGEPKLNNPDLMYTVIDEVNVNIAQFASHDYSARPYSTASGSTPSMPWIDSVGDSLNHQCSFPAVNK